MFDPRDEDLQQTPRGAAAGDDDRGLGDAGRAAAGVAVQEEVRRQLQRRPPPAQKFATNGHNGGASGSATRWVGRLSDDDAGGGKAGHRQFRPPFYGLVIPLSRNMRSAAESKSSVRPNGKWRKRFQTNCNSVERLPQPGPGRAFPHFLR